MLASNSHMLGIDQLVEAKHQLQLSRALGRWARCDLIAIDEVGYVPLAEIGAEFLFQVIAERAEKTAVIVTTNLPFSESTQVHSQCPALQGAGRPDYRPGAHHRDRHRVLPFRRTLEKRRNRGSVANMTTAPPPLAAGKKED
jgi:hypothetical protein